MIQAVLRRTMRVDANRQLHIDVPAEMGDEFDIIVLAALKPQAEQELTIENLP